MQTNEYVFFYGGYLSQWFNSPFQAKSIVSRDNKISTFNCAEQYMMAEKALLMEDKLSYEKIMKATSPKIQKQLGREIKNYSEEKWRVIREKVVFYGNMCKFSQNKELKEKLLSTKNKILAEASPYDKIWGIGLSVNDNCIDQKEWRGLNLLGKILMKVREELT